MSNAIAIKVKSVSKDFILPHRNANSVKSLFTGFHRKNISTGKDEVQHALANIDITIKQGEFFGIVGRNGSGKSTLLKILAGIYQPSTGSVETKGKLVPFIELGVGFNPELTGRENVYLNGAMLGFSEREIDDMYDNIVEFAELERFMDQKLKNYSSGMQVRLAFSMATRSEADILLVDEVLAVGDADFQRKCFDYFRKLKKDKKTVVFVTHDMNAVREYCDRAVLIEKSKIVKAGTSSDVATAYSKMFIESSTGNNTESKNNKTKNENRWGNGDLKIIKASIRDTKLVDTTDFLYIEVKLKAQVDVEDVALGFTIKSPTGMPIVGTNNQILKQNIKNLDKNTVIDLVWKVPNIFSEGLHSVTLAAIANSQTCDWWEEALTFKSVLEEGTPYIVTPHISLNYSSSTAKKET